MSTTTILDADTLEGPLLPFGGPGGFLSNTDYGRPEGGPVKLAGGGVVGEVEGSMSRDEMLWARAQLARASTYRRLVDDLIAEGKVKLRPLLGLQVPVKGYSYSSYPISGVEVREVMAPRPIHVRPSTPDETPAYAELPAGWLLPSSHELADTILRMAVKDLGMSWLPKLRWFAPLDGLAPAVKDALSGRQWVEDRPHSGFHHITDPDTIFVHAGSAGRELAAVVAHEVLHAHAFDRFGPRTTHEQNVDGERQAQQFEARILRRLFGS
ncbi:hypothetical protein BH23CHL8_BH23CHL8_30980 [soil metagenome]